MLMMQQWRSFLLPKKVFLEINFLLSKHLHQITIKKRIFFNTQLTSIKRKNAAAEFIKV